MRILFLDILRGLAVLAMIIYHFFWDLGFFGYIDFSIATTGLGLIIAQIIGASFILISGFSRCPRIAKDQINYMLKTKIQDFVKNRKQIRHLVENLYELGFHGNAKNDGRHRGPHIVGAMRQAVGARFDILAHDQSKLRLDLE